MVVSKDTTIKLVYYVIRLFRFIDTTGLFTLSWGTKSHHPHLSLKRDQTEMRDYMDMQAGYPTSLTWRPPPPCKQALNVSLPTNARHIISTTSLSGKV